MGRGQGEHPLLAARSDQRDTVKNLKIAWRQSANPDALKQAMPNLRPAPTNYQNTPLMVGGLVYMSTGMGTVAALDAATGKVVWLDRPPPTHAAVRRSAAAIAGVAYWSDGRDGRILAVTGAYLVALEREDRRTVSEFGANGQVDLRLGLSRAFDGYSWRSAPIIVRDVVVVGSVVGDINSAARPVQMEAPPGDVRGYDVRRPASCCGRSTRFRGPAKSATRRGRRIRGPTPATPTCGAR